MSFHVFFAFYAISDIFRIKICWREISGDRVALFITGNGGNINDVAYINSACIHVLTFAVKVVLCVVFLILTMIGNQFDGTLIIAVCRGPDHNKTYILYSYK